MIIGLCGQPSSLKKNLLDFLVQKSFYLSPADPGTPLEADKNQVVDIPGNGLLMEQWKNRGALLIGIGSHGEFQGLHQLDPQTSAEEAASRISDWVMEGARTQSRPDWDEYFMKIAQVASMRSNCLKRKVGAVIVRDRRIVSTGYNGTPRGTRNCNEGGCPRCNSLASSGTKLEECLCSHAEENAITQAAYHGVSVKEGTIYTTFAPCLMCSKMIINCGIVEVVFNVDYPLNDTSFHLFEQAGVRIRQHRLS
ncbi:MAG: dCMP deaminase family protein [Terriglobia bacterium]